MALGQRLEAAADVFQRFLQEGLLSEHAVEMQVEQSDACQGNQPNMSRLS